MSLHPALDALIAALLVVAAFFALVGSIGLVKLGDFMKRLHGPTKASTLGVGGVLIASILYFTFAGGAPFLHELLITGFVFLTAPIGAHLMAHAAIRFDAAAEPPRAPTHKAEPPDQG
jgi:multicomponent K+:H+ antiporter subunit G